MIGDVSGDYSWGQTPSSSKAVDALEKQLPSGVLNALEALASAAAGLLSGLTVGATWGSAFPGVGTVVGAALGALIGFFSVAGVDRQVVGGVDDDRWDSLGRFGRATGTLHESDSNLHFATRTGLDISPAQYVLVAKIGVPLLALPNWKSEWPSHWRALASGEDTPFADLARRTSGADWFHSPLLADSVARFVGAPQGGAPFPPPARRYVAPVDAPRATGVFDFVPGGVALPPVIYRSIPSAVVGPAFPAFGPPQPSAALVAGSRANADAAAHVRALQAGAPMSTGAKVAIGVGVASVVGVGAAHVAGINVLGAALAWLRRMAR